MIWILLLIIAIVTALVLVSPFSSSANKSKRESGLITGAMVVCIAGSLGLYAVLGTPSPPKPEPETLSAQLSDQPDILGMVNGLAERLMEDPENADGWTKRLE